MKLAILHYHLDRGGVTRVIENHLRSLDATTREPVGAAILSSNRAEGWPEDLASQLSRVALSRHIIPSLNYDSDDAIHSERLAGELRDVLQSLGWRPDETLLHVHNHALGKNLSLPVALEQLAAEGWRLLLQIHDFAEDFRPTNFERIRTAYGEDYACRLYPQGSGIHYALLNHRDKATLAAAGVAGERLHLLPNPVLDLAERPDRDEARRLLSQKQNIGLDERFILSPVRGIRRKNIGELILLSLLDRDAVYGLTLVPRTPAERRVHDRWRADASRWKIRLRFATGEAEENGLTFAENLAAADDVVTTSVAEGFGMTFLEPWLAGKPLRGRDLPAITADFAEQGVTLEPMYSRIAVPVDWLGRDRIEAAFRTASEQLLAAYRRPKLMDETWQALLTAKIDDNQIDFGDLNEDLQERLLQRLTNDPELRRELVALNPAVVAPATSPDLIAGNASQVRSTYGLEPSGQNLGRLYEQIMASPARNEAEPISGETILDRFLDLRTMRLVRVGA